MNQKKKSLIKISGIAIFLIISFVIFWYFQNGPYRHQLPSYPDFQTIPAFLQKQILNAGNKASRNPSADNLGNLGMVYYSCNFNEKAEKCYQLAVKKTEENGFGITTWAI